MKTIATTFSCAGGVELGAREAGFTSIWGVENDPKVAEVYRENIGDHLLCEDVADVDVGSLERPDILWASPPCQGYSTARTIKTPHESQDVGLDIIRYIEILRPEMFILENVPGYLKPNSPFWEILKALAGYFVWFGIVDAADFGVPQHRRRLICIASKDLIRSFPQYATPGWDSVLREEHLVEADFPPSIKRWIPKTLPEYALIDTQYSQRKEGRDRQVTIRAAGRPAFTICRSHRKRNVIVWRANQPYKLSPRGFAQLQSFPESFVMPKSRQLAIGVIGDAVPPLMTQRILEAVCF